VVRSASTPYRRLAAIYFAYFAFIGAFSPYFALYLQSVGQAAWQIGLLLSLMQLMRIAAPYFWASLADRHGWRARLLQGTLAAGLAAYAGVFATTEFAGLFVALVVHLRPLARGKDPEGVPGELRDERERLVARHEAVPPEQAHEPGQAGGGR